MALVVGKATVATGMSPVVEAGLYADKIFIDGLTFNSAHRIDGAGQIQVVVPNKGANINPKQPGSDFTDEAYANTVIDINCNNGFQKSVKVPNFYEASMPMSLVANEVWNVTEAVRVGRQASGLGVLISEGTPSQYKSGSNTVVNVDSSAITATNVKGQMLKSRSFLRKKHVKPNAVLCSVDVYSKILEAAGKDYTPLMNDDMVRNGSVGYWLGMYFIEADSLSGDNTFKFMNASGTLQSATDEGVDFIMYDAKYFSLIDRLDTLRIVDSEMFNGKKLQEEVASGIKVTNKDAVLVYKSSLPTTVSEQSLALEDMDGGTGIDG